MKLSTIVKIAITSSVVLLCTGFALYSFFRLSSAENQKDFNLYTLVPLSATAVLATDDAAKLVVEVDELTSSKNHQYLYASKLFGSLKQYFYAISEDAPHGVSRQMNQVLISFHEPDNDCSQVLYCNLGSRDQALIEQVIQRSVSSVYPPKIFNYKGEEITIYSTVNGDFLSCYLTSDFMALSYQKKLIEEVIDARKTRKSLAENQSFARERNLKKSPSLANIYMRFKGGIGWTEFEMKLQNDFIYLSGVSRDMDSCSVFVDALCRRDSVTGFSGEMLPETTFLFSRQGLNKPSLLHYVKAQHAVGGEKIGNELNEKILQYLIENTKHDLLTCYFQCEDVLSSSAAITSLSAVDIGVAEKTFNALLGAIGNGQKRGRTTFCHTSNKVYPIYQVSDVALFSELVGLEELEKSTYVMFYGGRILLASDAESLLCYIRQLDAGKVLNNTSVYQTGVDGLSNSYQFMLMANFQQLFQKFENENDLIPNFILRNFDFFSHFTIFVQLTCANKVIYSNVVLKYKSE